MPAGAPSLIRVAMPSTRGLVFWEVSSSVVQVSNVRSALGSRLRFSAAYCHFATGVGGFDDLSPFFLVIVALSLLHGA